MKCTFVLIAFVMCSTKLAAQIGVTYPNVQTLRTALMTLATEYRSAFQNIKGTLRYTSGTTSYYNASVHIVQADTPKIAEDTNPLQVYYMNFVAKEMTEPQSKEVFAKWQDLMQAALTNYTNRPDGNQYPDLESMAFFSPDGGMKFTLYRNGTGNACQVSVSIMNNNPNVYIAPAASSPKPTIATNAGPSNAIATAIDKVEFGKKIKQLVVYAKTNFAAIKGEKLAGGTFPANSSTFWLPGATQVKILNVSIGIDYEAYYAKDAAKTQADALFDKLRGLLKSSLPTGFAEQPLKVSSTGERSVSFVNKAEKVEADVRMAKYSKGDEYNVRLYVSQTLF